MKDWTGNKKSIFATLAASNHAKEERQAYDYYATDPIAIDKLLEVEQPNKTIWECACGGGHLASRLAERGYEVHTSDIQGDILGCVGAQQLDFLACKNILKGGGRHPYQSTI